jgi:hypothetical protein
VPVSLQSLIEMTSESFVSEIVSGFVCAKDDDIDSFIKTKAALFDRKGKSKTHFLLDEDALLHGRIEIVAFFSLAIQLLKIPEGATNAKIRRLDGLYSRKGGSPITEIPSFLIGQLAKNDKYANVFPGKMLLEYALSAIAEAERIVGGRVAYVECRDVPELVSFYERNGFKALRRDPFDGLVQLYCIIGK